jgi:hypothetical protein
VKTHGVEVEVIGDTTLAGVAQTSSGTLLIFENSLGAYAVYSPVRSKVLHVHIPIKYLKIDENRIMLNVDIVNDERGVKEVLTDLLICLRSAECYIDTETRGKEVVWKELRSTMPLVSWLCGKCRHYKGAPIRILTFTPFGLGPHLSKVQRFNKI